METAILEAAIGSLIFIPAMMIALWLAAKNEAPNVFSLLLPTIDGATALSGILLFWIVVAALLDEGGLYSFGGS